MTPYPQTPRQTLKKAFLKIKPVRSDIERFKAQLAQIPERAIPAESEEFHKNLISDFLKKTGFEPAYYINTKGRSDLVIHNGKNAKSTVGVIIETKRPANKAEMPSRDNINTKAFHELILYYLRERITNNNLEIKHLIVTNIYEWFIFDAAVFEKAFAQDKKLVKQFEDFEAGRLAGIKTDFFYNEIAAPAVEHLPTDIPFAWFNLHDYEKPLKSSEKKDENLVIALYKLLSPEHLLKLPFVNDSNSLDKRFYSELLHIIGLQETKQGSKKLIGRADPKHRNPGSLIENAIVQLDSLDKINRLQNPGRFGDSYPERLFNVALELAITWINRILFLKLLEAQLISYHKNDSSYSFLTNEKIRDFDDLNSLFFQVLARKADERSEDVRTAFQHVPYLNSSLFEPAALEHETLFISNLRDTKKLPILSTTVLKDETGKRRNGELPALAYLFDFLDAYDFAAEGSATVLEDNKSLINASVLGLIFEKINGYKEGSFFTPGFITMYMSRETIRRAVVQKFNETKGWQCRDLDELYNKIDDRNEANDIINSLKIVDPAVGSGHFLVSALNEIIAIKNDLDVLQDKNGRRLKNYRVEVENDELMVTDEDGEFFVYNYNSPESRRVQETLFREKQTIIENCLFGVDINPNSVNICRLRLWIELLKNAYYNDDHRLETLPNLDINIKCGNSLISRFALDADLGDALKKSKWSIDSYRLAVDRYRNAQNKEEKREMEQLISDIKSDFRSEIAHNDSKLKKLLKLKGELTTLTTQTTLFEMSATEKKAWNKKVDKLTAAIKKIETELEEIKNNKIFENAFEWRFEFPEVLNDEGNFTGFDVVIGNPPYILIQNLGDKLLFDHYKSFYQTATYKIDTYHLFYERAFSILKKSGFISYISPNSFLKNKYARNLRQLLLNFRIIEIINFYKQVFEDASVDTLIIIIEKSKPEKNLISYLAFYETTSDLYQNKRIQHDQSVFMNGDYEIELDILPKSISILEKLKKNTISLKEIGRAYFGIQTFNRKEFVSKQKLNDDYKPVIDGSNVKRYFYKAPTEYILFKKEAIKSGGDNSVYKRERIVVRQIGMFPEGTIIPANLLTLNTIYNIFLFDNSEEYPLAFILGIINSKLIQFFWKSKYYDNKATFPKIKKAPLESIPIINYGNDISKSVVQMVNEILKIKSQNPAADTTALERKIDRLVYALYGLTEEEIGIVEGE